MLVSKFILPSAENLTPFISCCAISVSLCGIWTKNSAGTGKVVVMAKLIDKKINQLSAKIQDIAVKHRMQITAGMIDTLK